MAMSRDRVRFTLSDKEQSHKFRRLLQMTLEMTADEARQTCWSGMTIICRPSQFARFLIELSNAGFQHSFEGLAPELIPAEEESKELHVWERRDRSTHAD